MAAPFDPVEDCFFGEKVKGLIASLAPEDDALSVARKLRGELPPEAVRRVSELLDCRRRAGSKFPLRPLKYLTKKGLEQSTPEPVARYRAGQVTQRAPGASVLDATCGIGSDSRELAVGRALVAADIDPFHLRCARENLRERDGRFYWHWDPNFFLPRKDGPASPDRVVAAAKTISLPVLLIRGRASDVVTEEQVTEFLELIPHAKYIDVDKARHMVAGDRNDIFTEAVVDFLQSLG